MHGMANPDQYNQNLTGASDRNGGHRFPPGRFRQYQNLPVHVAVATIAAVDSQPISNSATQK